MSAATSELQARADAVVACTTERLLGGEPLQLVKAPPGAGKTHLLLQLLAAGYASRMRLAVATFTNAQADDICRRIARDHPGVPVARFLSKDALDPELGGDVTVIRETKELPAGPCIVVASTAKWGFTRGDEPFDVLLVDEAWQISWADFLLLRGVAGRFVLIGDPGQIPPVVSIPTQRWETSPNAPHTPTPQLLLENAADLALEELPGSRRLPADAVEVVNEFYDFDFGAFAHPEERFIRLRSAGGRSAHDKALELLACASIVGVTIPTPDDGPPVEVDDQIAAEVSKLVKRLLEREPEASHASSTRRRPRPLSADDIGIVSTHRTMNTQLHYRLPKKLQGRIRVDTPERWQGLERKLMIAVHPLSGVTAPTAFELETGRLCVMASRHQCGLIVVTRDHVADTLRHHIVSAEQPVGRADVAGLGHHRHTRFWDRVRERDCVIAL